MQTRPLRMFESNTLSKHHTCVCVCLWRRRVDADTAALREEHASSLNAMRAALTEAEAIAQASEARLCS